VKKILILAALALVGWWAWKKWGNKLATPAAGGSTPAAAANPAFAASAATKVNTAGVVVNPVGGLF
jgi:hypothetical protein